MLTDLFYSLNFTFSMVASIVGLIFCFAILLVVALNPTCRNPTNLLLCNMSLLMSTYFINTSIISIYGFREEWAEHQPLCSFRGYCFLMSGASICYAYLIQAISRLFFTVFYKNKHLQSYRIHCYLIVSNWIFGIIAPLKPLFSKDGYRYERESRLCTLTTQNFSTAIYSVVIGFVISLVSSLLIYFFIFVYASRSFRRVGSTTNETQQSQLPNMKREIKLIGKMLIINGLFILGGTPALILILWNGIRPTVPPPEPFYLLIISGLSLSLAAMMVTFFFMNKQIKDVTLALLLRCTLAIKRPRTIV